MGPRVALVTARDSTELFGDGPRLQTAFARLGMAADPVPWGRDTAWARYDGVVIRGAWDYIDDRSGFLQWAADVEARTRLANSLEVLRWNTDKRYLRELDAAGIPTVPTLWVDPGEHPGAIEWDDFVVKPAVSAGARLSARYHAGADIDEHLGAIHASGTTAMIQPYVADIDTTGETGTYVFGDAVSHAISKGAILQHDKPAMTELDEASHQLVGPSAVDPDLAAFALRVLAAAPPVLYARVDTAPGPDGSPVLLELEVTEPYLFLEHTPVGAHNYARAVAAWLDSSPPNTP
jgi:hypothetical protein